MTVIVAILLGLGLFFLAVSCIGLVRLPDFYSRNHAAGKSGTLSAFLIIGGLMLYTGWDVNSLKLLFILLFMAVSNPAATHAIARAAYRSGIEPWTAKIKPQIKDDASYYEDEGQSANKVDPK